MPQIVIRTFIRASIETVFDAARDAQMHTRTTSHTLEKIVAGRSAGLFELHDEVTFEATHLGVRQKLTARIVEMNMPDSFSDEMLRGAFASLRHVHHFQRVVNGTCMTDILTWKTPLGWLGIVADRLFLIRYMTRFLEKRNVQLKKVVESDTSSTRL